MKEKSVKITPPEGYEVDKEKSSFNEIVFRAVSERKLPKTWEELDDIKGHYVNEFCSIFALSGGFANDDNRNVFPTREEAEASLALAQLCQLRDRYNGGWKANWKNKKEDKYCIQIDGDKIRADVFCGFRHTLSFETSALCNEFIENFTDLIEKAKPLLG